MRFLSGNNDQFAKTLGDRLAGPTLTKGLARLYSQHTKLRAGKKGLESWKEKEVYLRIEEAERLIVAALSLKDKKPSDDYFKRAAEIFEWIATIDPNPSGIPVIILAAASYQLGGYPARSLGVLSEHPLSDDYSKVLDCFLRGNFRKTQNRLLLAFEKKSSEGKEIDDLPSAMLNQVLRALGVFVSWMRWGDDERIETAITVLENVARATIHDIDTYSWLLAILVARIARKYKGNALWEVISPLKTIMSSDGQEMLGRYARNAFEESKSLAWPSQRDGIKGITTGQSFALCTPTGSGKTRVAELAILQSLFPSGGDDIFGSVLAPVVLYLAPSKSLSSEVEANLAKILFQIKAHHISVTSMYGGNDIGPSDIFTTLEQPTVLISTHEKADALIRYLGIGLFARISCVVVDEAHTVAFSGNDEELCKAESRSLRLEVLVSRLKTICAPTTRFIALSAVASDIQDILAEWVSGIPGSKAISTQYRSTRQLLGQLQCYSEGNMAIQYDVLDGHKLILENREDSPYVPKPFPPHPKVKNAYNEEEGIEKKMRVHLLWAAMQFAVSSDGKKHSVLISATEHPEYYAETFLVLLENDWLNETLPDYSNPYQAEYSSQLMAKCLASCEDYFGIHSREYRLLKRGIVLHHGKMPPIMSRFLIELIQAHVINIVIATSTLSEGINLPFETVLIPSLRRSGAPLTPREAINLMGRAGRPGVSTEGRSLVLLAPDDDTKGQYVARGAYASIINSLTDREETNNKKQPHSPLLNLIRAVYNQWHAITKVDDKAKFIEWLETATYDRSDDSKRSLLTAVDTFDQQLLSAIEEMEQISADDPEKFLQSLWKNTVSYYDSKQEPILEQIIIKRGCALIKSIYPERARRTQMYYTGLPPRDATTVLDALPDIKEFVLQASDYTNWNDTERLEYLLKLMNLMRTVESFSIPNLSKTITWQDVFIWWMAPDKATKRPTEKNISKWYDFAAKNFVYKFNWALGSVIGSILHRDGGTGAVLQQWNQAQLPWAVLWFKDLITWGVLDPVASFLMAKKQAFTRKDAKALATEYWNGITNDIQDSLLEPKLIYKWLNKLKSANQSKKYKQDTVPDIGFTTSVQLLEDFKIKPRRTWQVLPADIGGDILWVDPAGFPLAKSKKPENWTYAFASLIDFVLNPDELQVAAQSYI